MHFEYMLKMGFTWESQLSLVGRENEISGQSRKGSTKPSFEKAYKHGSKQ